MKPQSISEKLMFSTAKLTTKDGLLSGTGFFFNFDFDGKKLPVIVTNRHVVRDNPTEIMIFQIHVSGDGQETDGNISIEFKTNWVFHPTHDLCFAYIGALLDKIEADLSFKPLLSRIDESLIWSEEQLLNLNAVEDILMIGYPIGLSDEINNFPIFRKGITASHPAIDFNKPGVGVMDMACFPGSSGSPIFVFNQGSYSDKQGSFIGGNRVVFLGVLYGGPLLTLDGKIEITSIPTSSELLSRTQIMINLGFYIKANEILKMKPIVETELKQQGLI